MSLNLSHSLICIQHGVLHPVLILMLQFLDQVAITDTAVALLHSHKSGTGFTIFLASPNLFMSFPVINLNELMDAKSVNRFSMIRNAVENIHVKKKIHSVTPISHKSQ
jgi:hypothetical protein